MKLILRESEEIDFLNKPFSILGEGEKSCQVVSCAGFRSPTTQLKCLIGLALQGIGFMNIIGSFPQNSRPLVGVPPQVYRYRYSFTLGDPFKKIGTSPVDPVYYRF